MPVKAIQNGKEVNYVLSEITEDGCFILKNEMEDIIRVEVPLKLDTAFSNKLFDIYFLAKKDIKESDIFQVYCRNADKRIGWLIPTIALSSSFHDYAENEYFLKYAYVGIKESLKKLDNNIFSIPVREDKDKIYYSEIFHDSTALLIISKETLVNGVCFDIDRASASLVKYGYIRLGSFAPDGVQIEFDPPEGNRLYIDQISKDIKSEQLISEILNMSFAYESKPVFKFFFIYQLFEMLIDDVFKHEQKNVIDDLVISRNDSNKVKDILDRMHKVSSEKERIRLLIENYSRSADNMASLRASCNVLLKNLGKEEVDGFQGYFYQIRNFIFHQYRDFPVSEENLLDRIINDTIDVLPVILSGFKYPS